MASNNDEIVILGGKNMEGLCKEVFPITFQEIIEFLWRAVSCAFIFERVYNYIIEMNCKLIALLAIAAGVLAKKRDEV